MAVLIYLSFYYLFPLGFFILTIWLPCVHPFMCLDPSGMRWRSWFQAILYHISAAYLVFMQSAYFFECCMKLTNNMPITSLHWSFITFSQCSSKIRQQTRKRLDSDAAGMFFLDAKCNAWRLTVIASTVDVHNKINKKFQQYQPQNGIPLKDTTTSIANKTKNRFWTVAHDIIVVSVLRSTHTHTHTPV